MVRADERDARVRADVASGQITRYGLRVRGGGQLLIWEVFDRLSTRPYAAVYADRNKEQARAARDLLNWEST